jgi:uncharacterized membrane protein YphA (DoxX/SURF4 family)
MKTIKILIIVLNLFVGGFLVYGSISKFGETPKADKMIEQVKKGEEVAPNNEVLMIKNYIFGMKQTGYFWGFLGIAELLAGVLLVSQFFARIGAIVALPITLNIFLFHLFLESHEINELVLMLLLLVSNMTLIALSYTSWKGLVFNTEAFQFKKRIEVSN